jgi:hypothetical protein
MATIGILRSKIHVVQMGALNLMSVFQNLMDNSILKIVMMVTQWQRLHFIPLQMGMHQLQELANRISLVTKSLKILII